MKIVQDMDIGGSIYGKPWFSKGVHQEKRKKYRSKISIQGFDAD